MISYGEEIEMRNEKTNFKKDEKTNLEECGRLKVSLALPLIFLAVIACAREPGKPKFKFRVIEFFPPSEFQINVTSFSITVAFSKIVDRNSITDKTVIVQKDGKEIGKIITVVDDQKIKITPELISKGTYKVTLSKDIRSITGETLEEDFSWVFYVVGEGEYPLPVSPPHLPPLIKSIYPPHLGLVGTDTIVYASFRKRIVNISPTNFFIQSQDGKIVDSSITYIDDGNTAVLRPKALLQPGELYIATLKANIESYDGEKLGRDVVWIFRTFGVGEDKTPPSVVFINPPDGAVNVPQTTKIYVLFSENIDPSSVSLTNVQILEEDSRPISYSYDYDRAIFLLTLKPSLLQIGNKYTVKIKEIKDIAGNKMVEEFRSSFLVGRPDGPPPPIPGGPGFPPEIQKILIDGETVNLPEMPQGVSTTPNIKIFFSDVLNPQTVNSSTLFISDGINRIPTTISFSPTLTTVSITPIMELSTRSIYWVFITNGIEDREGENLANPITFPFKTLGIHISYPHPGQFLKGIINIDVDFSAKLSRLELWIDSVKRQSALPPISSPFTFTEDTRIHPDGARTIKAVAHLRTPATTISYAVLVTFDNTPPTIVIQSPPEESLISGITNITVLASDSGKIKKVDFYVDNVLANTLTSPTVQPSTYIFTLNTVNLSDGRHTISFRAEDMAGNTAEVSRNVIVDNTPPTASFTYPLPGSIVGGIVELRANASDNRGVKKVSFYIDSSKICDAQTLECEVVSPPWAMKWDSTNIPYLASASVTGVVEDLGGLKTVFSTVITVDNTSPSVSISSPPHGMYIRGVTVIRATFSDHSPVTYIVLLINDIVRFFASNPPSPYTVTWDTTGEPDGVKTLKAVAFDKAGNAGSSHISVVVDNTPPSGTIISPPAGTYTNALTLSIEASATDNILLDRVEFYLNENLIGVDSSPPYKVTHNISALAEGTHSITAAVFDLAGNRSVTPAATTFVIDRTAPVVSFVEPTTDSIVEGTRTVRITAFDSGIVTSISARAGNTNLGSCTINATSGDCIRSWATSGDANNVVLTAKAADKAGNEGTTSIVVMVNNLFPSVSITSPTVYYLTCPTNTVLGGTASDTNTITAVVMNLIDLSTLTTQASFTFTYPGNTTVSEFSTLTSSQCGADGSKRFQLIAFDKGGKKQIAARDIFVDNTQPHISVIYPPLPPSTDCVSGVTTIRIQICDNAFLHSLSVAVDTTLVSSAVISSSVPCSSPQTKNISWNSASFSDGPHTIYIYLKDAAGNTKVQNVPVITDNSPPSLHIVTPPDGSNISTPVSVQAILGDSVCAPPAYAFRKIEYQIALSGTLYFSSSVQSCASTQRIPCTDSDVGTGLSSFSWAATEYCGFYKVKARGFDYAGNVSEKVITLRIQPPGCPIEESWSPSPVVGAIRTTPIIRDISSPPDGQKEIIFGTETGRVYGISGLTTVQNATTVGAPIRTIMLEALVAGLQKAIFGMLDPVRKIRAINLTPPVLSDFASVSTQSGIYSSASTIFADGNTAVFLVGDLSGRIWIYEINSSGLVARDCIPLGTPLECGLNSPAISDVNGDTQPDVMTVPLPVDLGCNGSYDMVVITASDGYITVISLSTKTKVWTIYTGSAVMSSPVLADFGNDCNFEILVGTGGGALYCVPQSGTGHCPGWTSQFYNAGGAIYSVAVTDIDSCLTIGDSAEDIVFGSGVNLTILSKNGYLKSQRNLMSLVVSTPAIADINNDGCGEIFIATQNGSIHGFYLKNVGGLIYPEYLTGFPKETGSSISVGSSPLVCNVDNDANLELILGNDGSNLRVYDLGTDGKVKWLPGATFCNLSAHGCQRRWNSLSACGY